LAKEFDGPLDLRAVGTLDEPAITSAVTVSPLVKAKTRLATIVRRPITRRARLVRREYVPGGGRNGHGHHFDNEVFGTIHQYQTIGLVQHQQLRRRSAASVFQRLCALADPEIFVDE
jgi:hypothetical protein